MCTCGSVEAMAACTQIVQVLLCTWARMKLGNKCNAMSGFRLYANRKNMQLFKLRTAYEMQCRTPPHSDAHARASRAEGLQLILANNAQRK